MADGSIRDKSAIAGIGTTEYAKDIGRSELQIALEAVTAALDDAGLSPKDVDAIFRFDDPGNSELDVARNLGVPNLRMWGAVGWGGGAAGRLLFGELIASGGGSPAARASGSQCSLRVSPA